MGNLSKTKAEFYKEKLEEFLTALRLPTHAPRWDKEELERLRKDVKERNIPVEEITTQGKRRLSEDEQLAEACFNAVNAMEQIHSLRKLPSNLQRLAEFEKAVGLSPTPSYRRK